MKPTWRSKCTELAWLGALAAALAASPAFAQACCANTSVLFPIRVERGDTAVAAISAYGRSETGGFDSRGGFSGAPSGTHDLSFEQRLLAAVRPWRSMQFAAQLPFVENHRGSGALTEGGGGVGDLQLAARCDVIDVQNPSGLPGLAFLGSVIAPTGTAVDQAHHLLATDATGQGAWQASLGAAGEYLIDDRLMLELTGSATGRAPRKVGGVNEQMLPMFFVAAALAYVFDDLQVVALTLGYSTEGDPLIDGHSVAGAKRTTTAGVFLAWPLPQRFRLQGALGADLPLSGLGQGQSTGVSLSVMVVRVW